MERIRCVVHGNRDKKKSKAAAYARVLRLHQSKGDAKQCNGNRSRADHFCDNKVHGAGCIKFRAETRALPLKSRRFLSDPAEVDRSCVIGGTSTRGKHGQQQMLRFNPVRRLPPVARPHWRSPRLRAPPASIEERSQPEQARRCIRARPRRPTFAEMGRSTKPACKKALL